MTALRVSIVAALALLAGCDGIAVVTPYQNSAAQKCFAAGMGLRVEYSTVPQKVWRIDCVPPLDSGQSHE